jgi:CheY-like chemotaxis protein
MGRNRRVLIADPDPNSQGRTVGMVRDLPYALIAAMDHGHEASATHPAVVLVAVEEPLGAGMPTVATIRQRVPRCPVIGVERDSRGLLPFKFALQTWLASGSWRA